jgi:flagellar protein FliJ
MSKFRFRLATLLRLREAARDERRAQLAEAYLAEQKLNEHRAQVMSEEEALRRRYGHAASPGALDVDRLLDAHRYQAVLTVQLKFIEDQAAKLAAEIDKRRQTLVGAEREVRVLENLRETWKERHRQAEQLAEMKSIDEVAGRMFANSASAERTI